MEAQDTLTQKHRVRATNRADRAPARTSINQADANENARSVELLVSNVEAPRKGDFLLEQWVRSATCRHRGATPSNSSSMLQALNKSLAPSAPDIPPGIDALLLNR